LEFKGIQKITLLDYPGKVAAIAFVGGCDFKCGYCYNRDLVLNSQALPSIPEEEVLTYLRVSKDWLDGLVVSGGEPTIHSELPVFLEKVKKLSFSVKLDTNGSNPKMLAELIEKHLVDYVAMDVKAPLIEEKYRAVIGTQANGILKEVEKSIELLRNSNGIDYEFRTTVIPELNKDDIVAIAGQIKGAKRYFIQQFRPATHIDERYSSVQPYTFDYLFEIQKSIANLFGSCEVRGAALISAPYEKRGGRNMSVKEVRKRDGRVVPFEKKKITDAIFKAAQAVGGKDRRTAERLADEVVKILDEKYAETTPGVEDIQDVVEKVLIEWGHAKTAKAYILYRKQRTELRKLRDAELSVVGLVDSYIEGIDWRVRENANVNGQTIPGLMFHASNTVLANYALTKVYPPEVADAHVNGDFHLHDLQMALSGYCSGWSLEQLLAEGFNAPGKMYCNPPRHLDTALMQMVNFIGTLQNEWAGAQAFNSVDVLLAPFVRADRLSYDEIKQAMQTFIFNLNITSRWAMQTPFTNITFALTCPEDLASKPAIVGGAPQDRTYEEYMEEAELINKAFLEIMSGGDPKERVFTFPIPTYSITKDFQWDTELADMLFALSAKYGLPYFQNFVNSDMKPSDVRSMCCRLRLDLRELRRNVTGGLFGSSDATGSVGVVTINMSRLGYLSKDEDEFFERLDWLMRIAKESLEIKRKLVERNIQNGMLPYTKRYLGTLNNHFSTIGLVGMNEACLNLLGEGIQTETGKKFAVRTLEFMREKLRGFQEETGNLYNLEASPAEGTSYRLARIDKRKYPDIVTAGEKEAFYTNSTCLPVNTDMGLFEALRHQEKLQTLYSGGTVFHTYLGESLPDVNSCKALFKKMTSLTRLPYFTLTPTFSICQNHGFISGEHFKCPTCGGQTEVYSRVVGYYRPVSNFNAGKKEEFRLRHTFEKSLIDEKQNGHDAQ